MQKNKEPPFFVDCITWTGTLSGPENAKNWDEISVELKDFIRVAPWLCKSLVISGDFVLGQLIERILKEQGVDYAIQYKYGNTYHIRPDVQTMHYMLTWGKSDLRTLYVHDEKVVEGPDGKCYAMPPNEFAFFTRTSTGKMVEPYDSMTPPAITEHGTRSWPLEPETFGMNNEKDT